MYCNKRKRNIYLDPEIYEIYSVQTHDIKYICQILYIMNLFLEKKMYENGHSSHFLK